MVMSCVVGDIFYHVGIDDEGKVWIDEWHVRSFRKGRAVATIKLKGINWKDGKWMDVQQWMRQSFSPNYIPRDFAKSKSAAYRVAYKKYSVWLEEDRATMSVETIAQQEKGLQVLKGFITKEMNRKKGA